MWRSLVARLLWEQDVAGSNPVIPTIFLFESDRRLCKWLAILQDLGILVTSANAVGNRFLPVSRPVRRARLLVLPCFQMSMRLDKGR